MKRIRLVIGLAAVLALGCLVFWVQDARRQAELERVKSQSQSQSANSRVPVYFPREAIINEEAAASLYSGCEPKPAISETALAMSAGTASQSPTNTQKEWQDPYARMVLAFVGSSPEADEDWYSAINDPNLPAKERQDLIEDLNEEGFADPKNPTPDDLPLILSRLELIEALAADAMDQVNADAFQEAYKDLVDMAARTMR